MAETESALKLSASDRIETQARLKALGFDPGSATGKFGPGTRRALTNWQKTRDLPESGYLTPSQKAALWEESESELQKAAVAPASALPAAAMRAPVVARTAKPVVPRIQPQAAPPRLVVAPAPRVVVRRPVVVQPAPAPAQRGPSLGEVGSFLGGVGSLVNKVRR